MWNPLSFQSEHLSDVELQTLVKQYFKVPKALQELPLILIPKHLLPLSVEMKQQHPFIHQAIQEWLDIARRDDEFLRIERRLIPHIPVYIANTSKGQQFFKIAKAIGDIPLTASVVPKNQNQGYWLKTLHYFWQARGVVMAQQLLGLIQNPLEEGGVFIHHFPDTTINNLKLTKEIDIACFRILVRGQRIIKQWAQKNEINYAFSNPLELFIEILKQNFLVAWYLRPCNQNWTWITRKKQRENIADRAYMLKKLIWQESPFDNYYYCKKKQQYLDYLQGAGWDGYWILAMRGQINARYNKHLELYLGDYLSAFIQGKELFVDEFDWRSGQPYKKREKNGKITNRPQQIQGIVDLCGYILWSWS